MVTPVTETIETPTTEIQAEADRIGEILEARLAAKGWDTDCRFCSATGRTADHAHPMRSEPVTASLRGLAAHAVCADTAETILAMFDEAHVDAKGVLRWETTNGIPTDDSLAALEVLGLMNAAEADVCRKARRGRRPTFGRGVPTAALRAS